MNSDETTWLQLPDLFRRDVDRTGDCWLWKGPTFLPKDSRKPHANYANMTVYAFVYRLASGIPAKGMEIHHACHEPLCVKPSHLEVLTKEQHMAKHGRGPLREVCQNGHSIKQFGEFTFPSGRKRCKECYRLSKQRRLTVLNSLPKDEKLTRCRKSNEYKIKRMERDPIYAAQQKAYRKAYNKRYHREHLREKRERYNALPQEKKLEKSRQGYERHKRRILSDPQYAEKFKSYRRKKLSHTPPGD